MNWDPKQDPAMYVRVSKELLGESLPRCLPRAPCRMQQIALKREEEREERGQQARRLTVMFQRRALAVYSQPLRSRLLLLLAIPDARCGGFRSGPQDRRGCTRPCRAGLVPSPFLPSSLPALLSSSPLYFATGIYLTTWRSDADEATPQEVGASAAPYHLHR